MIGDISRAERIYIVCGYTDMRKAIDGLAAIVQQNYKLDVFSGSLFLFCGKRCDRIKALLWEEDGFVLLYKRLEWNCQEMCSQRIPKIMDRQVSGGVMRQLC